MFKTSFLVKEVMEERMNRNECDCGVYMLVMIKSGDEEDKIQKLENNLTECQKS